MTYEKIVEKMKAAYCKANAKNVEGHIAIQFNILGEGEGALYLEINEGKIAVEPYEYYDRDAIVTLPADVLIDIADGKRSFEDALQCGDLRIDGNISAALVLNDIKVKKPAAKKPAAKKPVAKKPATKKPAAKKPVAKKAEPVKKTVAKKATAAKKPAAKKTTTKKAK